VESFLELSLNPVRLSETISSLGLPDSVKGQMDELAESIQSAGKIDIKKDLLAHIGPKMVFYLAPGRSAATTNEETPFESLIGNGLNPMAAASAAQSVLPKLTLVAEVKDPVEFGKILDSVILAINGELKAQAIEKASKEREAEGDQGTGGRNPAEKKGGGDRTKRRRPQDTPAPHFQATPGEKNSYVLMTPSGSPLRFGPSAFRPTIHLDDKYLAFSLAADSGRAAINAVKRKGWNPSATTVKATEHVPSKLIALMVNDVAETLPSLLANLPGTLQTSINTSIALSHGQGSSNPAAPNATNQPTPGGSGGPMAGGMAARMGRRPMGPNSGGGGPSAVGEGGAPPPRNSPGASNSGGNGTAEAAMIQFKIDPDKLPKADDLKNYLFASTWSVSVSDEDIRVVSRGAFPNLSMSGDRVSMALLMPALKAFAAGQQARAAQMAAAAAANQPAPAAAPAGPAGGRPMSPGGGPANKRGGGRRGPG
jgi:hypothetical protein